MKKILGLDLGTNSIGWALIEHDFENKQGNVLGMGSRIIPMSQEIMSDFGKGNSTSQTAKRTEYRGARRLRERHLLRRERLHCIFLVSYQNIMKIKLISRNDSENLFQKLNLSWLMIKDNFYLKTLSTKCWRILKKINLNY